MQIFVCGMHRSGTSVIARLLNMLGAYIGPEGSGLAANAENPKGFWERADIVALNDRILAEADARWFDPYPWLTRAALTPSGATKRAIRDRLLDLDGHRPWFIKDPRLCLTLGTWLPHCERPVVVICSRDAGAVASSLAKHGVSIAFRLRRDEADALWETYSRSLLQAVVGLDCIYLSYEDVLASPIKAIENLYAKLVSAGVVGLRLPDPREVDAFVDPQLQHHATPAAVSDAHRAIVDALRGRAHVADIPPLHGGTLKVLAGLHQRLRRMDAVGGSGMQDRDKIEVLEDHIRQLHAASAERDLDWSMASLRRLLAPRQFPDDLPSDDA